jgi:hypothetical protein
VVQGVGPQYKQLLVLGLGRLQLLHSRQALMQQQQQQQPERANRSNQCSRRRGREPRSQLLAVVLLAAGSLIP